MKYLSLNLATAACLIIGGFHASAQTVFTNADGANSFISTAGNWDNGLPVGQQGTIGIAAQFDTSVTHTGYDVIHSDGLLSLSGVSAFSLSGSTWLMNGTATTNSRGLNLTNSSSFTIDVGAGDASFSNNNRDILANTNSSLTLTSGNLLGGRSLTIRDGGSFTMNGGTVSFTDAAATFGTNALSTTAGTMNLNGGTINADRFLQRVGSVTNFGGSASGSATFNDWGTGVYTSTGDRVQDNNFTLDFATTTQMTLTLSASARALNFTGISSGTPTTLPWAEALWGQDQLLYNGQTAADLGLTWAQVTTTGFGDGNLFDFDQLGSFGGTLAIIAIPEPSTWVLLAGSLTALFVFRRRRTA